MKESFVFSLGITGRLLEQCDYASDVIVQKKEYEEK